MGYIPINSLFRAGIRPPDPPGQRGPRVDHGDDAEDLIEEANILVKEISAPMWITGSIPTMLQAFTSTSARMESLIPPEAPHDLSVLYHPAVASEGMVTGSVNNYTELIARLSTPPPTRRPPPPVMRESSLGMKPLKNIEETVKERYPELYNNAHGRRDKWSEWKYLFKKLHAWWKRDFS